MRMLVLNETELVHLSGAIFHGDTNIAATWRTQSPSENTHVNLARGHAHSEQLNILQREDVRQNVRQNIARQNVTYF